MDNHEKIKRIVLMAILSSLVIVLQLFFGSIKLGPVSVSFVLVPIAFGAIMIGPFAGAILGAIFGIIVLINGFSGQDAFTLFLLERAPIITILVCMVKGVLAGLLPGLIVKWMKKSKLSIILASIAAPIANTLTFIVMVLTLLSGTIQELIGEFNLSAQTTFYFLVFVCAGWNFLAELAVNAIVSPSIYTLANKLIK